ncbi:MAG: DUF2179 domain-containing protein [Desulfuromonadales bacterium]|nr:DUF2179 domain-containing protein [Desulfuromonadales bacterium]
MSDLLASDFFSLVVIPVLIFVSRIVDVTFGTLRIIFVARGLRSLAALVGFFEVLIWILAIGQVMQNLTNWVTYAAYAGGFSAGNFVGVSIERRIAIGSLIIRVITRRPADELVSFLHRSGYGVTSIDAQGETGPVKVIFTIVKRKKLPEVIALIHRFNPNAFYTIEDVRFVNETWTPVPLVKREIFSLLSLRKRK